MVILKHFADEQIAEEFAEVGVVGPVVKLQGLDILEVLRESIREATAEVLDRGFHFISLTSLFLSSSIGAFRPCQGREPRQK